jgi:hypothetical protein
MYPNVSLLQRASWRLAVALALIGVVTAWPGAELPLDMLYMSSHPLLLSCTHCALVFATLIRHACLNFMCYGSSRSPSFLQRFPNALEQRIWPAHCPDSW